MRVAFDTRPSAKSDGVGRYARCLLRSLRDARPPGHELLETERPSTALRSGAADVLHSPCFDGAMLHSPCPMVVTIHDLSALKRASEHLRGGVRTRLRQLAAQRAAGVIAPTETVALDAGTHLGIERERVTVIPEAADASMYRRPGEEIAAVRERLGLPEGYLVLVGGLQHPDPAKHIARLAGTRRDLALVMVGATRPWAHELPDVILTGEVCDEDLAAIYSGAHALVLTSENEGFGLPAVEALACGTPVAACEAPAVREVLGDRATFVCSGDMQALVDAAQAATRPAPAPPAWTWDDAARSTWGVYASVAALAHQQKPVPARADGRARRTSGGAVEGLEAQ